MRISTVLLLMAAIALVAAPASAEEDWAWIKVDSAGTCVGADSSGYPSGAGGAGGGIWYYYPLTDWTNTWFYNQPFKPPPWYKVVTLSWSIDKLDAAEPGQVEIVINWATDVWSAWAAEQGLERPPLPDDFGTVVEEEEMIGRWPVATLVLDSACQEGSCGPFELPVPYNPEWVSIDVRGVNFDADFTIIHECLPEPVVMALMAVGGLALVMRRRRR